MRFKQYMRRYLIYLASITLFAVLIQTAIADSLAIKGRVIITIFFTMPYFVMVWTLLALKDLGKRLLILGVAAFLAWAAPAAWIMLEILSGLGGHGHIQHENLIVISITILNAAIMILLPVFHEKYKLQT